MNYDFDMSHTLAPNFLYCRKVTHCAVQLIYYTTLHTSYRHPTHTWLNIQESNIHIPVKIYIKPRFNIQ